MAGAERPVETDIRDDTRFLCRIQDFRAWVRGTGRGTRMEFFYRDMRRRTGLLMEGNEPGRRQVELRPREPQAARPRPGLPRPPRASPPDAITREVMELVAADVPGAFR